MAWGGSGSGQTNVPAWLGNVVAIAAGGNHSLALTSAGQAVGWGDNSSGQSNVPVNLGRMTAIAAGASHNLALRDNGTVAAWGGNTYGQTNVPAGLSNVIAIAAGDNHSLAVKADGTVTAWGSNTGGQRDVPAWLTSAVLAAGGTVHSLALRGLAADDYRPLVYSQPTWTAGTVAATLNGSVALRGLPTTAWFEWGTDTSFGQVTRSTSVDGSAGLVRISTLLAGLSPHSDYVCRIVASNSAGLTRGMPQRFTTGRKVASWAINQLAQPPPPPGLDDLVALAAGDYQGLGVRAGGTVVAWGKSVVVNPQPPTGLAGVVAVAGGMDHGLALRTNGTITAWGAHPPPGVTNVPAGLTNVIAIAARDYYSLALQANGTVVAWGLSTAGETNVPPSASNLVAIAAGDAHCLALRMDGTVVSWGSALQGATTVPAGLAGVAGIGAGWNYSYAVRTNGTVVGWGSCKVPSGLANVTAVTGGDFDSLALQYDGRLVMWSSMLGMSPLAPAPPGLSNVVAIASGNDFHLALSLNVLPQTRSHSLTNSASVDCVIYLNATDANNDPLTRRITVLPPRGALHQYTAIGRGDPITTPDTAVTDPTGRVVFVPEPGTFGIAYANFAFTANDGEYDAPIATVSLSLVPLPMVMATWSGGSSAFTLGFTGLTNAAYRVWASTNLTAWTLQGAPSQIQPGVFQFTDTSVTQPQRFYRISCP